MARMVVGCIAIQFIVLQEGAGLAGKKAVCHDTNFCIVTKVARLG